MAEPVKEKFLWRIINLGLGFLYMLLSFYVVLNQDATIRALTLILAVVLLFSGILRVINAFFERDRNGMWRIFYFVFGLITVFLGLSVIVIEDLGRQALIALLAFGLILQGLSRIATGFRSSVLPNWLQFIFVLFGVATIILAAYVMIDTTLAIITITVLLAYGFLLNGFARLLIAFTGYNPYYVDETEE